MDTGAELWAAGRSAQLSPLVTHLAFIFINEKVDSIYLFLYFFLLCFGSGISIPNPQHCFFGTLDSIFERYLDSNQESCRSKQARYQLSHPSPFPGTILNSLSRTGTGFSFVGGPDQGRQGGPPKKLKVMFDELEVLCGGLEASPGESWR